MRNKIVKEIRKYLREMYPGVEEKEPEIFKRMMKDMKRKYLETPTLNGVKKIEKKGEKNV